MLFGIFSEDLADQTLYIWSLPSAAKDSSNSPQDCSFGRPLVAQSRCAHHSCMWASRCCTNCCPCCSLDQQVRYLHSISLRELVATWRGGISRFIHDYGLVTIGCRQLIVVDGRLL